MCVVKISEEKVICLAALRERSLAGDDHCVVRLKNNTAGTGCDKSSLSSSSVERMSSQKDRTTLSRPSLARCTCKQLAGYFGCRLRDAAPKKSAPHSPLYSITALAPARCQHMISNSAVELFYRSTLSIAKGAVQVYDFPDHTQDTASTMTERYRTGAC